MYKKSKYCVKYIKKSVFRQMTTKFVNLYKKKSNNLYKIYLQINLNMLLYCHKSTKIVGI